MSDSLNAPYPGDNQQIVPDEGQGDNTLTLPIDNGQESPGPSDEGQTVFHSWKSPDGNEVKFANPEDLNKYLHESSLRHSDYTRKTQTLAEERKRFENDRAMFLAEQQRLQQLKQEVSRYDEFLKQNPHIVNDLKKRIEHPDGNDLETKFDKIFEEKYGSKLKEIEAYKVRMEAQERRNAALNALKSKYPDADENVILDRFDKLREAKLEDMFEMIYASSRFQPNNPARKQEDRDAANLLPSNNGGPGSGQPPKFKSYDDWAEAMKNRL